MQSDALRRPRDRQGNDLYHGVALIVRKKNYAQLMARYWRPCQGDPQKAWIVLYLTRTICTPLLVWSAEITLSHNPTEPPPMPPWAHERAGAWSS